jgi:excinuclease ABC subunit C
VVEVVKIIEKEKTIAERIKEWPTQPGVYMMRDPAKRILYVGKAKNLRNRIRSYFQKVETLSPKTRVLVRRVADVEFTTTQTELEALLLECNLIKQHRPRYNMRLKDDKAYPYVVIDSRHPFPQFRMMRKVILAPHLRYFGPFNVGVQNIERFLLKTFQIRDCSDAKFKNRTRPCLNYEIGTCTAPCVNYVDEEAYGKQIRDAVLFLKGKKRELLRSFKTEMEEASDKQQYERAKTLRDKIDSLVKITAKQSTVLAEKTDDVDVVGLYVGENEVQWTVLFIRSGLLTGRRAEKTPIVLDSMEETTRSFIEQFYTLSLIPDEVWVMEDFPGRDLLEQFLKQKSGRDVTIRVRRGERAVRLLGMAAENAKLIYQEQQRKGTSASMELQRTLGLPDCPHTIEGIDVSNIQGTNPAVALVHFAAERPLKSKYRLYYPKTVEGQNDFAMIHETIVRRYSKPENPPPDLLMIDGGKGQLSAAVAALKELGLEIPVCSLAKSRTASAFTRKEITKTVERIFLPDRKNPLVLKEGTPALMLLQQVRDEAHRFSVKSHRVRRRKAALEDSVLTAIAGIGEITQRKLLRFFGGLEAIRNANRDELVTAGLNQAQAAALWDSLHKEVEVAPPSSEE